MLLEVGSGKRVLGRRSEQEHCGFDSRRTFYVPFFILGFRILILVRIRTRFYCNNLLYR